MQLRWRKDGRRWQPSARTHVEFPGEGVDRGVLEIAAALEAIGAVGSVEVSDRDDASSEGGKSFLITFTTARGDVPELRPVGARLTGAGAAVHVAEVLKGSEARGDAISISYDVPRECSESQVTRGACGASVDKVELQTSSTASFEADVTEYDMPADYTRQMVRIASGAFEACGFETPAVAGHFRLGYGGATTPLLGADAVLPEQRRPARRRAREELERRRESHALA